MLNKCFVILFNDGSMQIFYKIMRKNYFHSEARIFAVQDDVTISRLCEWIAGGYKDLYKEIRETKFAE